MRRCKVCNSPHRVEYEQMYLDKGMYVKDIWRYAVTKYGENISYPAFSRHFRYHVKQALEIQKKLDRERQALIRKYLQKDLYIAEKLSDHLEEIEERIAEKCRKKELSPQEEKMLLKWLEEARLTIDQILRWRDKLEFPEISAEDIGDKIVECMKDFPPELIEKFLERWKQYVESRKHH